ncbi:MAG: peptidase MA family metallohydrolase [Chloroflexota bacterium]
MATLIGRVSRAVVVASGSTLLAAAILAGPVAAADPVEFGTPTADSKYGTSIEFHQPVDLATRPTRVELLLRTPDSRGPGVIEVPAPAKTGSRTLDFSVDLADGHIVPNTTYAAQWRVTDADGKAWVGPSIKETYADTTADWKTLEGDLVRVHWYEGGASFGRRALEIGENAVKDTSQLLGVSESDPIDFFIYADQDQFYTALGPATRENVGGEAHADIRTMFALITPAEINDTWVEVVVPHELTHLVFDTATRNPFHEPPHWINEGLAVYLSEGYKSSDRDLVERAAKDSTLMPLDGLVGAFPTSRDRFFLAYAESVSAVDAIVQKYGRDALVGLIRSYADGVSDDEAFKAALGVDTAQFQQAWLDGVGAQAPVRHGPQPAPVGPLPQGWSGAAPNATIQPGVSAAPGTGGENAPVGQPAAGSSSGTPLLLIVSVAAAAFVVLVGAVVFARRRRHPVAVAAAPLPSTWTPRQSDGGAPAPWSLPAPPDDVDTEPGFGPPASTPFESAPGPDSTPAPDTTPATDLQPPPTAPDPDRPGPPGASPLDSTTSSEPRQP